MSPRRLILRRPTWAVLILFAVVTAAWPLSGWRMLQVSWSGSNHRYELSIYSGLLHVNRDSFAGSGEKRGLNVRVVRMSRAQGYCWRFSDEFGGPRSYRWFVSIPLWCPVALLAMLAAGLLLRDIRVARRAGEQLCERCAYPRFGLPPQAPCPECGHAPPPPTEPRP